MNLFKFSITSVLVFFSLFFYTLSSAVTVPPTQKTTSPTVQGVLVATVNIKDAKIVFQNGKTFRISFTLTNREELQTGVKYGVQLISDSKVKYLVDEKVYDQSITLHENSTTTKTVEYTPPSGLSGDYILMVTSQNESGFSFAGAVVGKIKLIASTKGVQILPESCYLQIVGEKDAPHYVLTKNVEISSDQQLNLTCNAVNNTGSLISVTPSFDTRYGSSSGEHAPQTGGDEKVISFAKDEKKAFIIVLPKADMPKLYNLKVSLINGSNSSNIISLGYVIKGASATIQQVSLDKDYYKINDQAKVSLLWFGSGIGSDVFTNTTITNNKNIECASISDQKLVREPNSPINKILIPIKHACTDPHVKVVLLDDKGSVLDQKDFIFKTINKTPRGTSMMLEKNYIVYIIISLLIIIGLGAYLKKKKKTNVTM